MAEALQPCCEKARTHYLARVASGITSYPVIKSIPCPTCKRIIEIRVYTRPGAAGESGDPNNVG
jgi:hypothetical protein